MNKKQLTWGFWLDAIERTVRTTVQAAAGVVLAYVQPVLHDGGWGAIDWTMGWQVAAGAALVTVLTALAAKPVGGNRDSASFLEPPE